MLSLLLAAATLLNPVIPGSLLVRDGLPVKAPRAVGMSAARLATIDRVVERGIKAGGYPGAAVVVGRKGAAVWEKGFGRMGWTADAAHVVPGRTIYDLASLTKVVGTTTAVMILFDQGKLRLDDEVVRFIPEFAGGGKEQVTIRQLLTHRSGLPAGRDLWRVAHSADEARAAVIATPLIAAPGQFFEYSDLGADVLAFVVEAVSGERLDTFLQTRVFAPLGMLDTRFKPDASLRARIAPTELTPPRGYPLRGEVHDENAYALGGIAGHAGLFGTVTDLSIFAQMLLNGGSYNGRRIVADSTVQLFTRRATGTGTRGLGWDTCAGSYGCGKYMGSEAYGHTGYTGTSLWIDPDREMFVILLTNRVHAAKARRPAKVISDVRADLADAASLAVTDAGGLRAMPRSFRSDRAVGWNEPERAARGRSAARSRSAKSRTAKSAKSARASRAASAARKKSSSKTSAAKSRSASARSATTTKKKSAPAKTTSSTRKKSSSNR